MPQPLQELPEIHIDSLGALTLRPHSVRPRDTTTRAWFTHVPLLGFASKRFEVAGAALAVDGDVHLRGQFFVRGRHVQRVQPSLAANTPGSRVEWRIFAKHSKSFPSILGAGVL